jgi:hypothetical protein
MDRLLGDRRRHDCALSTGILELRLPYLLSGTDQLLLELGIGVRLSPAGDLDFAGMFHGVDERVPVESLLFGTRVLLVPERPLPVAAPKRVVGRIAPKAKTAAVVP